MEKSKAGSGLSKPMNVSADLAAIVGDGPMARTEVTKKLWVYIKENNLQDPNNKRNINTDEKLKKIFDGNETVNMFEMTKYVSKHLT
jgi:chromatin remodeling complex protein RSC6